jgi:hypothetical protein
MRVIDCVQLSPEWWEARRGLPTCSEFNRIITAVKGEYSKGAEGYIDQLIGEVVSLDPPIMTDWPGNPAMKHGRDTEAEARNWYAVERNATVRQTGFCIADCGRFGGSPDGLVDESDDGEGVLELKCPQPQQHVRYLRDACLPADYKAQCHGHLLVSGRGWVDFMSYARGFPPLIVRVKPDAYTRLLEKYLERFWVEYQAALELIRGK